MSRPGRRMLAPEAKRAAAGLMQTWLSGPPGPNGTTPRRGVTGGTQAVRTTTGGSAKWANQVPAATAGNRQARPCGRRRRIGWLLRGDRGQ